MSDLTHPTEKRFPPINIWWSSIKVAGAKESQNQEFTLFAMNWVKIKNCLQPAQWDHIKRTDKTTYMDK